LRKQIRGKAEDTGGPLGSFPVDTPVKREDFLTALESGRYRVADPGLAAGISNSRLLEVVVAF
jgi:hypothetical protein